VLWSHYSVRKGLRCTTCLDTSVLPIYYPTSPPRETTVQKSATRQHSQATSYTAQETPMLPQLTSCEWSGRAAGPLGRHQRWLHRPGSASPPSLSVLCWQANVGERKETQKSSHLILPKSQDLNWGKRSEKTGLDRFSFIRDSKWNKQNPYNILLFPDKYPFFPSYSSWGPPMYQTYTYARLEIPEGGGRDKL
jgi:hypothetical protein